MKQGHFQYALLKEKGTSGSATLIGLGTKSEWARRGCLPDGYSDEENHIINQLLYGELSATETCEGEYLVGKTADELREFFKLKAVFEENKDLAQFLIDCTDCEHA